MPWVAKRGDFAVSGVLFDLLGGDDTLRLTL